jgi:hypothetical protein
MTRPYLLDPKFLKEQVHKKSQPEFAVAVREMELAHRHADEMLADGRLSKAEHEDFEAHLYGRFIQELPVSEFQELLKNGGMDDLQALAGHDGSRDVFDVEDARQAVEAKIKMDALDNAWAEGRINNEYYAKENQRVDHDIRNFNEDLDDAIAGDDFGKGALHYFVERHDDPGHEKSLSDYLADKYGSETPRNSGSDAPAGYVEHNVEVFMHQTGSPARREAERSEYRAEQLDSQMSGITSLDGD